MRPLLLVLALSLPTAASADAISPEPTDCPTGSDAVFCHGPPTCAALHCTSDGDCDPGLRCAPLALCTESHSCGGILGAPVYDHALSACDPSGACATGTCMAGSYCVPDGTDAGSALDAATAPDAPAGLDSGAAPDAPVTPMDTGSGADTGARVVTSGCSCRAGGPAPGVMAISGVVALFVALSRRRAA